MSTPPPPVPVAPRPRRLGLVLLLGVVAVVCVAAAARSIFQTLAPASEVAPAAPTASAPASRGLPLRDLDVDRLASQYLTKHAVFEALDRATLAAYDRRNPPDAPWFAEGRKAVRLLALFVVWNDFYGQGILQAADGFAAAARKKGCRDPLVAMVCDVRLFRKRHSNSNSGAQAHIMNVRDLLGSDYPVLYKFVATGSVLGNLVSSSTSGKSYPDLAPAWEEIPRFVPVVGELFTALLAENLPSDLLYFRTADFFDAVQAGACLAPIEQEIETAFARVQPDHPARAVLRGDFLITWAWQARGTGWANSVSEQGWRLFANRLEQARDVLTAAWEKDPDNFLAPTLMLTVALGRNDSREVMEMWFERAMKANPDNYMACNAKAWYLQPRWHGSARDVGDFGAECVATGNWAAKLPLVLPKGLADIGDQDDSIYESEAVWKLVKPVYEEFLDRYPESIGIRTAYATWAARSNHLDELRVQLAALGPNWDRDCWDDAEYRRISALAKTP